MLARWVDELLLRAFRLVTKATKERAGEVRWAEWRMGGWLVSCSCGANTAKNNKIVGWVYGWETRYHAIPYLLAAG